METEEDGKEDSKWKQKKMEKKIIDGNKRRWKGHVERKNEHRRIKKTVTNDEEEDQSWDGIIT